jgi:DNA modification methylase
MVELNKIYNEDCLEFMKTLPDKFVDCIITSPPYMFEKEYDSFDDTFNPTQYEEWLTKIFEECTRILKDDGRIFVNVQPIFTVNYPTHHIVSNILTKCGLTWGSEIIWEKNNYNCPVTAWGSWCSPSKPYLKSTWEYIEYFFKNNPKHIGDKENISIVPDEFKKWTTAKWNISPERRMKEFGHPAMFPEELVERILKLFTFKNDIVYDPFSGVGTTCTVCERLDRKYIGTEISKNYYDISVERVKKEFYLKETNNLW